MEERRSAIVELINSCGTVTFRQLKEAFPNVSDMTLRTDLKALDQDGRIVRVHGGARSVEQVVGTDGLLDTRSALNTEAKAVIAHKASGLIAPNSTVFLDSGSTTTALARVLPNHHSLYFTNSITCGIELSRLDAPESIVVGGHLNRYSLSMNGSSTVEEIRKLAFDILFLGVTGYQDEAGITCGSSDEATLKRVCMERASKVVALMDSSKVGRRSTFHVCDLTDLDVIVSDNKLPEPFLRACELAGVEVL